MHFIYLYSTGSFKIEMIDVPNYCLGQVEYFISTTSNPTPTPTRLPVRFLEKMHPFLIYVKNVIISFFRKAMHYMIG